MEFVFVPTRILHSPEFIGSEPVQRATWLAVTLWCAQQENGGVITGAKRWGDRQWQQTCGVTAHEVNEAAPLLNWDGDNITVWAYPDDKEAIVRARREVARENGQRGGRPLAKKPTLVSTSVPKSVSTSEPISEPTQEPTLKPISESIGEDRRGEDRRRGVGKKKAADAAAPALPAGLSTESFKSAWAEYEAHRTRMKARKLKPESVTTKWAEMAEWGEQQAIESIRRTIGNGWIGLFPPDQTKGTNALTQRNSRAFGDPNRDPYGKLGI